MFESDVAEQERDRYDVSRSFATGPDSVIVRHRVCTKYSICPFGVYFFDFALVY